MADHSTIEWTDATWNPVTGCSVVSPGCTNCYAMKLAGTRLRHHWSRIGLTKESKSGPVWTGEVRFNREWLTQPLGWKKPRMIFVCAHGDLFHPDVPDAWIDQVFAVMALCPQHTFQVLTKRPERMREYLAGCDGSTVLVGGQKVTAWHRRESVALAIRDLAALGFYENIGTTHRLPLPNVWLGTSVEDQRRADERIPHLLATPAAVRFVSAEPLLGQVDLLPYLFIYTHEDAEKLTDGSVHFSEPLPFRYPETTDPADIATPRLDWVIVGGESGDGARPMHPDWARSLRDQCATAAVPFFFKQRGPSTPVPNTILNCVASTRPKPFM